MTGCYELAGDWVEGVTTYDSCFDGTLCSWS